ncbi:MAG: enoyl-CoA hydratase-related protein [Leptospiraceae bacterium]|nr:enoyl-CoA hydratase-related protein [Leptospiraceae bacterium]
MELKYIKYEKKDGIGIITINKPETLNALSNDLLTELGLVYHEVMKTGTRVTVITGEGKAFVAGADISEMKNFSVEEAKEYSLKANKVFGLMETSNTVSIAAINGFALGGGLELALSCNIRIASEKAKLGMPEVSLGLIPGFGGTQRLTRLVGESRAMELILSANKISAEEASRIGLVNRVTSETELMTTCLELAKSILANGTNAIFRAKEVIQCSLEYDYQTIEGLKLETETFSQLFSTAETKEGLSAFLEKRKPNF